MSGRPEGAHLRRWVLALFAPLLLVAVFGGIELQRQSARVADAVQQQAAAFLHAARLHFGEQMRQRAAASLASVQLGSSDFAARARTTIERDDRVLDLFCLDGTGQLVYPRLPVPREAALPFLGRPASEEILLAEHLLQLGGRGPLQRARTLLERYLGRRPGQPNERARAAFRLGTVLRQLGELSAAEEAFLEARLAAVESDSSPIGLDLLTRLAIAEMAGRRDSLLELAREIATNAWFAVPDELAGAVFARALAAVPANGTTTDHELAELRAQEAVRRSARRFAAQFERFAAPVVQRVLADEPAEPVLRSIGSGAECALLALRATTAAEQAAAGRNARWLGLRLDLPRMVNDAMDAFLTPGKEGHRLEILDQDGVAILDTPPSAGEGAPEVPALAGLVLRAVPVDPGAALREQRDAVRNRILILASLLALALGSGLLLMRSVAREAELATLKMEFVSRMSHELKTPLSLIKMYGETLALGRADGPAQTAQFGGIVAREADRLTGQIDRILVFAQQQSGQLRYAPQHVDLRRLVADAIEGYREHVEQAGCTLEGKFEPSAGSALAAAVDPHAFHLALVSLIENAVKYTPKDGAERTILVEVARAGDHAVVAVHDRGIGIPEGERERVFEAFYRATNAGEVRGAGLGLGQVRHFVRAHRGEVDALARPGGGTTVRMRLPLLPPRPEGAPAV